MFGHNKSVAFSAQYSNVWTSPNQMMYEDSGLSSVKIRQDREARILMHNLDRQLKKVEEMKGKKVKEEMAKFYLEQFGIVVSA